MGYISFARKYRPQTFDEMVGQDHIVTTLKNAIAMDRVAHAYIFSGPRGIGKTTTARLLSKSLNCEKGPTPTPCNTCQNCVAITQGSGLEVLEIDGASNRGIDEIRNLRDNVKFAPSNGAYKIYIIDEVHMLTQEAFNALLKTLEEPPPRVKFIFATTRINKIPPTILSRCQRLDFKKIAASDIIKSLASIAGKEKLSVKDEVFEMIALHSEGCLRDAEVLLDQLSTFGYGTVTVQDAARVLGVVDETVLHELTAAVADKDAARALQKIDELIAAGKEVTRILTGLIARFRNLAVVKVVRDASPLSDIMPEQRTRLAKQAERFSVDDILYAVAVFSNAIDFVKRTQLARIPLEMAMVKLCQKGTFRSLDEIARKMRALEEKLGSGYVPRESVPDHPAAPAVSQGAAKPIMPSEEAPAPQAEFEPETARSAAPASSSPQHSSSGDMAEVIRMWPVILERLKSRKMSVASYLMHGRPVASDAHTLTVGFPKSSTFHKETLEHAENSRLVENIIESVMKRRLKIIFVIEDSMKATQVFAENGVGEQMEDIALREDYSSQPNAAMGDPIVKDVMDILKGEVVGFSKRPPKEKSK